MWKFLDDLDRVGNFKECDFLLKIAIRNPYEVMGLSELSTPAEIKKRYRELALKYHPDLNPSGGELMKEINEAYSDLSSRPSDNSNKTSHISRAVFEPLLNFLNSKEFFNFYQSGALLKYYRYQVGFIKKKIEKEEARAGIEWLRSNLKHIISNIYSNPSTPKYWSISEQNIINIISKSAKDGISASEISDRVLKYLES